MIEVWCFGCGGEMKITHEVLFNANSYDEFVCDTCISHNEEVSSWYGGYEYEDYELAYAGFEE